MTSRIKVGDLQVAASLYHFVNNQVIPGTNISSSTFWGSLSEILEELSPTNRQLLYKRKQLQDAINQWNIDRTEMQLDPAAYQEFLQDIGYIVDEPANFTISPQDVDTEITSQPAPQLVVPVKNTRFALNAANARWGSLSNALKNSDILPDHNIYTDTPQSGAITEKLIQHLDDIAPLSEGSHKQAIAYRVYSGSLEVLLDNHQIASLANHSQFVGYQGSEMTPEAILLLNNGLHIVIQLDYTASVQENTGIGISDVLLEAATTTIMDCEDSVAAVDTEDKIDVYKNWLGLMKGDLTETFTKDGKDISRRLNPDLEFLTPDGKTTSLPGRSLMLVRNVGHLMTTDAVLDRNHNEVPEGILDGMITTLAAIHDLNGDYKSATFSGNSRYGSIYIVKPKMHGPEEVEFSCKLFDLIEQSLGLTTNTIKIGIMDEERRTTLNLKACIQAAKERVAFINTGFLDRTGDEIHTSMLAGPMPPKAEMKQQPWLTAYEKWNVDIALSCGFQGKAQIGKGMWPMPDEMAAMMDQKINHLYQGASTSWVPSANAATLHSLHYHKVDVIAQQTHLRSRTKTPKTGLLNIPVMKTNQWLTPEQIQSEIDNNTQSILGYVVHWINQGIGCSKVADINNIGLMEDRATLRISSQLLANWIHHGICSKDKVRQSLEKMSAVVDKQNIHIPSYIPLSATTKSVAFEAACDLVFKAKSQPNGYTEPLLHQYRLKQKLITP